MFSIALFFGSPNIHACAHNVECDGTGDASTVVAKSMYRHVTTNSDSNNKKYTHNNKAANFFI